MDWKFVHEAKLFAIEKHKDQMYGESPYSFHLAGVVCLAAMRNTHPELKAEVLAACWLHDTIEDTGTTLVELSNKFGWVVARAVLLVSKRGGESYEYYMSEILECPIAIEVKKCDTMFNLNNSFKEGNKKRIAKYIKQLDILERGYV